jgi:hypothetical protein
MTLIRLLVTTAKATTLTYRIVFTSILIIQMIRRKK